MPITRRCWIVLGLLAMLFFPTSAGPAQARSLRDELWITNGTVNSTASSGNTLYLGGSFSYVGPRTGNLIALTQASGERRTPFPMFDGQVRAIVADGAGGWYVAGSFQTVNNTFRPDLAHLRADLTLDQGWNPPLNGDVQALAVWNNLLYVGLAKTRRYEPTLSTLAALDANGAIVWSHDTSCTDFDICARPPCLYFCGITIYTSAIFSLLVDGDTLYAGGSFTAIDGQPRNTLAALDAQTGALKPWNPGTDEAVTDLALQGTTLYASGEFTKAGGQARDGLAAIDSVTGVVTPWNPTLDGPVYALVADGSNLYVGGDFSSVGGQPRKSLAAFNTSTGTVSPWNPALDCARCDEDETRVFALARNEGTLYAGGSFTSADGKDRHNLVAINTTTGKPTDWSVHTSSTVNALAAGGALLLAGGEFTSAGGQLRENLAALDLTTGELTAWKPSCGPGCPLREEFSGVRTFALSGPTLYLVAEYPYGSEPDFALAAVNVTTGAIGTWNPPLTCDLACYGEEPVIQTLVASGRTLYISGSFNTIDGLPRSSIAAMDTISNTITSWNPTITDDDYSGPFVSSIAISGNTIYIAGNFTSVGGQPRQQLAAIDATSASPTAWNPTLHRDESVKILAVHGETVYIANNLVNPFDQRLQLLTGVSAATGLPTWTPESMGRDYVYGVTIIGDYIYVSSLEYHSPEALSIYRVGTETPIPWTLIADDAIYTLVEAQDMLYIGGTFTRFGGQPFNGLAAFDTTIVDSLSQRFLPVARR